MQDIFVKTTNKVILNYKFSIITQLNLGKHGSRYMKEKVKFVFDNRK